MTRKDYELIAQVLASVNPNIDNQDGEIMHILQWRKTCEAFSLRLTRIYPRFNSAKFLDACGYTPDDET